MSPWVKWCIKHRLEFVVYIVVVLCAPAYIAVYIPEGFRDWLRDFNNVKRSVKHERGEQ